MMSIRSPYFLLPFLVVVAKADAGKIYSFAEGKSHPEGLKHGARGHACLKEFHELIHGSDMEFLKEIDNNTDEVVTDDHVAAAIFMVYGEKGINKFCNFSQRWKDAHTRRLQTTHEEQPASSGTTNERRTQEEACGGGSSVDYPGSAKMDPSGVYSSHVAGRIGPLLPDGAGANSRTSPAKMVTEAQVQLDDALEGQYSAVLCGTYFAAATDIASVPDLVVFKQGPILDGINSLTCGIAERSMLSIQATMRGLLADGIKHDALINRAEMSATYGNSMLITQQMCSMTSNLAVMNNEVETIKEKVSAP